MNLHESGEMYLETIYVLSKERANIRAIDVGDYMGYSKPSVSRAISILRNGGFVVTDDNGHLTLTDEGLTIAKKIYQRHLLLEEFLLHIGLDQETATNDACKIEHAISDKTYLAIKKHLDLVSSVAD
ncbi:MAG: metal-dependent transcriptional regulator [Eubacteriales bacterium]